MNPSGTTLSGWLQGTPSIQLPPQGTPGSMQWANRNGQVPLGLGITPRRLFPGGSPFTPPWPRPHAVPDPSAPSSGGPSSAASLAAITVIPALPVSSAGPMDLVYAHVPPDDLDDPVFLAKMRAFQQREAMNQNGSDYGGFKAPSSAVPAGLHMRGPAHPFPGDSAYPNYPVGSASSAKIPLPQAIDSMTIKNMYVNDPDALAMDVMAILRHIRRTQLEDPYDLMLFLKDVPLRKNVHACFQEYSRLFLLSGKTLKFDESSFLQNLVAFVTGEVRPREVIALEELVGHEIVQGSDPATKYAARFHQRARILPTVSQAVFCRLYLAGLKPGLRTLCC